MILCGLDLETPQTEPSWGLQPWRARTDNATVKTIGLYSEDLKIKGAVCMPSTKTLSELLMKCADGGYTLAVWNGMFDAAWLISLGLEKEVRANRWLDAMLLLKRIDAWMAKEYGGIGFGLKASVAERWPQYADYGLDDEEIVKVPQTPEEWGKLLKYQFRDAKFTTVLCREFLQRLSPQERRSAFFEATTIPDVAKAYVMGIHINRAALEPFKVDVETRLVAAEELAGVDVSVVRSPKKLRTMLFDDWGYEPIKKTPAGEAATDKETLLKLAIQHPDDPRFKGLMDLRKCNTQQTKFVGGVIKSTAYHGENVVRPMPILSGTYSGRFTYASTQGKGKGKCQTGIALHQWERGKPARDLLMAPPGYLLAEFDFSGQEMRLMAMESGDEVMLDLFASGGDGHAYMGASIENLDYEWVKANHDENARAKEARNLGKFCVAEGMPVLTERGLVPIEQVTLADRVWDGVEWVTHTGAVFQGVQEVIEYQGIQLTPTHNVYTNYGRIEFQEAAQKGIQITRSGCGRHAVRILDSDLRSDYTEKQICFSSLQMQVLDRELDCTVESADSKIDTVQELRHEETARLERPFRYKQCSSETTAEKMCSHATEMSESKRYELQKLRGKRNRVPVQFSSDGDSLHSGKLAARIVSERRDRQDRQQSTLRDRESEAGDYPTELAKQTNQQLRNVRENEDTKISRISCAKDFVARGNVHRTSSPEFNIKGADTRPNKGQILESKKLQTKRTWDITNAGPRNRFTVCDLLIHNSNLSLQYRIGVDTIMVRALTQYGLQLWRAKAQHIKDTYLRTYKRVPQYWTWAIKEAAAAGYAETRGHRRIPLYNLNLWEQQQTAINYRIQGTGGDMKTLGIAVCKPFFNGDMVYGWDLHDALFTYVKDDEKALGRVLALKELLSNLPYKKAWGWSPEIPLPVDAKIGKTWGTLKGV